MNTSLSLPSAGEIRPDVRDLLPLVQNIQIDNSIYKLYKMTYTASVIPRQAANTLVSLAKGFPIVAVTGPRQSGKTTLVQAVFREKPYVSLEEPDKLELAMSDPRGFLDNFPEGTVIDEGKKGGRPNLYIR
jgi:hypothetical protein